MKKHIFTITCILMVLACVNIYAQDHPPVVMQPATTMTVSSAPMGGYSSSNSYNNANYMWNNNYSQYRDNNVNGNRFFYDDNYRTGELWTKNGHYVSEMLFRIDQLDGSIQVKLQNGKEMLVDAQSIIMLHLFINGKKIVFVSHDIPDGRKNALLQVIYYSSNLQLLRDSKKALVDVTDPHKVNKEAADLAIKNDYRYYITENDNAPLKEICLTEKEFVNAFPEHRNKIVQFFKVNNTKEELTQTNLTKLLDRITQEKSKVEMKD